MKLINTLTAFLSAKVSSALSSEEGAELWEYVFVLAILVIALIAIFTAISGSLSNLWTHVSNEISSVT
jgi:Flp pilus assembly pilin Flp